MIDIARPIAHFTAFTAMLRRAQFAVAPEQTLAWLAAIDLLGPEQMGDIRRAARATLAPPPERFAEFDALFDAHFLGAQDAAPASTPSDEAPLKAAEQSGFGPEPVIGEDTRQSGAQATTAERLATRSFSELAEEDTLRRFARSLPRSAPRRRGYRWRDAPRGPTANVRGMLRAAMRNAGEFVRLRRRRRRLRPRRILLLIDISGSMKERTHAHLAFAHALARAADAIEVFTFGTRLTRITRALRRRDRSQALSAAAQIVADWDGGTRIGEALAAFLAIPRFAALARGAGVIVLSDGLERGDPGAMTEAIARISRLAWRTVWLTPLATGPGFEPRTNALRAARPYLNELGDARSLDSICASVLGLARARAA